MNFFRTRCSSTSRNTATWPWHVCLPIALDQAHKQRTVNSGDLVLLVTFGSGFVFASALVRM
ncbi:MAG: 3-oxoacyl-[acyl-carrier-protein] synthase III C-terminal domain-containing protein [Planctomycetota bacterium]